MKKIKMVTGKVDIKEREIKDLSEIISGKKGSKFSKYADKSAYKSALFNMNHLELCEELMRLNQAPSCEKEFCRTRCLALFDAAQKPRNFTHPDQKSKSLEDIISENS